MASINVNRATSTLMEPSFLKSAVMIVVGSLLAQVVTNYLRSNVRDIQMAGGDALYAGLAALLVLTVLPKKYGKPLALGASATSVRVMARELGIV
jgi:hypothetical protein